MQKVFESTKILDENARLLGFSDDVLMENAAAALEKAIRRQQKKRGLPKRISILIVAGGGNNGADGWTLARRIAGSSEVCVFSAKPPKSQMCVLQSERAKKIGVSHTSDESVFSRRFDFVVDCLFGSGFSGEMDEKFGAVIRKMNEIDALKIACDSPSGIGEFGKVCADVFCADETIAMGAPSSRLFSDEAKDFVGKIRTAKLGFDCEIYAACSPNSARVSFLSQKSAQNNADAPQNAQTFAPTNSTADEQSHANATRELSSTSTLAADRISAQTIAHTSSSAAPLCVQSVSADFVWLKKSDLTLPLRRKKNVFKNSFGHLAIFAGEKEGAAIVAAQSALAFGAGLASIVEKNGALANCPAELMHGANFNEKSTAALAGCGLGRFCGEVLSALAEKPDLPCVLDADILRAPNLADFLRCRRKVVITPHIGEFAAICRNFGFGDLTSANKLAQIRRFCAEFPHAVIVVKSANTFIAQNGAIFAVTCGKPNLAKAGSGDVLAGATASLLAQGWQPLSSARTAVLAHAVASCKVKTQYGLSPADLIRAMKKL